MRRASIAIAVIALAACAPAPRTRELAPAFVGELAIGELASDRAVVWARSDADDVYLHVRVDGNRQFVSRRATSGESSRSARVVLEHLAPGAHRFTAWWSRSAENERPREFARRGRITLPAAPNDASAVRFAWSGDIGGQDVCRRVDGGFPTIAELAARPHDFFVALGDLVYADNPCGERSAWGDPQVPLAAATDLAGYRAHWVYALEDEGFQALRRRVYVVWDDHEIANDAGPQGSHAALFPIARRAFVEANPLALEADDVDAPLYRAFRWGRHLDLALLDARSHRASNAARDDGTAPKSMLGAAQRAWLERRLSESDATWFVIASSVPLSVPTGSAEGERDGWADHGSGTGFERELLALLRTAQQTGRRNLLFITTDVHFTAVFRYVPFEDDPSFVVHEIAVGPLAAGIYPIDDFDETLRGERLLFHRPADAAAIRTLDDARPYLTWGEIGIDPQGALTFAVRNADRAVFERTLPAPAVPR